MHAAGTLICPILVGRDDLLELGDRRLAQAAGGRGHLLFLAGEAGIGKTRLLGALARKAEASGFAVAGGDVGPRDLEVPAALLFDLTRSMARRPALRAAGEAIRRRLADSPPHGPEPARPPTPAQARRWMVSDVADILAGCPAPLLLAMENLHWADDLSLEILGAFALRLPELPVLVAGTYRSDELYPRIPMREWRSRLVTQRIAEEARLGRLSTADTGTMTTLLLASGLPASRDVVEAIQRRTDGIPLHVEEFLGVLRGSREGLDRAIERAAVPDTIESTVRERLERRSAGARALAEAAAVIGRSFVVDVAAGVLGEGPERLAGPLRELIDQFFLVETGRPGLYDFRHVLIRDAIYGTVEEPRRRRFHARAAELGQGLPGAGEAFASAHFEQAGRTAEAFETSLVAARSASALSAHREAVELYRRALRNVPADLADIRHAEVLEGSAVEAAAVDDNQASADAFAAARERYLAAGRPVEAAAVMAPLVAVRHLLGDGLGARVERLETGLAALEPVAPGPTVDAARLGLLAGLSAAYMLDRRLDESIAHGRAAEELATRIGDRPRELNARTTIGSCLVFSGRMSDGWAILEGAIQEALDADLEDEAARAYRMAGSSASVLVEYDRAERYLGAGIDHAERVELWNHRHYMAAHLAHVRWATGHWDDAAAIAAHALADGRGGITTRITALHVLGYLALGRGDPSSARERLDEARELGDAMRELQRRSPAVWGLAELDLLLGDPDAAVRRCDEGREQSVAVDDAAYLFPFLVTGTRARIAAGDAAAAGRWVADLSSYLQRRAIPGTLPAIDHAWGLVHLARGSLARAQASLDAAVAGWTDRRRVPDAIAAQVDAAACHLRAGRAVPAIDGARAALEAAATVGAGPLEERARTMLEAARARHPDEAPWAPLTSREFEVARLVAEGRTNASIGQELGISARTAGAHVEHILAKLGAGRRAEIAAWVAARPVGTLRG